MIGDEVAASLAELRAQAESLMRATVTITRATGTVADADGRLGPQSAPVYEGKARVLRPSQVGAQVDAAGKPVTIQKPQINLPVGAYAARVGDLAVVTANPDDPNLAGHRYRVTAEAPAGSLLVQYRLAVEEVL